MLQINSQKLPRWSRFTLFTWLTGLLWLAPHAVQAQVDAFPELEDKLRRHPSLMAHEFEALAERETAQAAYALPDPELSLGINNLPVNRPTFDRFLPTNKAIGVQFQVPSRAGREARANERFARADGIDLMRRARYDALRAQLIIALVERHATYQQRQLTQARMVKYEELLDVSRAQIDAGKPVFFRLAQVESERAEVARELAQLDGKLARIDVQLIDLVGDAPDTHPPQPVSAKTLPPPSDYHAVRIAKAQVDVAAQSVALAKTAWKPQWGAQLTYQQRASGRDGSGADFSGDDWISGKVTVSLPVWASRRQQPKLRAAEASRSAALSNVAAAERFAVAQHDTYAAQIVAAVASRAALTRQIAAIERQSDAQLSIYESGEGTYAPVVDGEIAVLKLRAEVIAENVRARSALARQQALVVAP